MVHLVRQYDRPAYESQQDWRLIMRSEKVYESKNGWMHQSFTLSSFYTTTLDPDHLCQHPLGHVALAQLIFPKSRN